MFTGVLTYLMQREITPRRAVASQVGVAKCQPGNTTRVCMSSVISSRLITRGRRYRYRSRIHWTDTTTQQVAAGASVLSDFVSREVKRWPRHWGRHFSSAALAK